MSSSNKSILRHNKVPNVENLELPSWDRHGNLITKKKKPQPLPTKVEDVVETKVSLPTLKEVEAIREDAYNEGFEQGYETGMTQGQRDGLTAGKKEGYDAGYQEGLTAGTTAGREQALAEERVKTDDKLTVLESVSAELKNQIATEQHELEQALLSLSVRIARQVIQDELRLKPNHISVIVHAAVQSLPNPDEKLTVLLNPDEVDFVKTFADSHWTLVADDSITTGGCKVKSGFSYVDYSLEHRFDNAVNHLISHLEHVDEQKVKSPISSDYLMRTGHSDESTVTLDENIDAGDDPQPAETATDEMADPADVIENNDDTVLKTTDESSSYVEPESEPEPKAETVSSSDQQVVFKDHDTNLAVEPEDSSVAGESTSISPDSSTTQVSADKPEREALLDDQSLHQTDQASAPVEPVDKIFESDTVENVSQTSSMPEESGDDVSNAFESTIQTPNKKAFEEAANAPEVTGDDSESGITTEATEPGDKDGHEPNTTD
ncbi:flagellar assembly protein FliH [Reinekea sp. G2M2-21]|uniref:flagellar assembly protein FliH n=1 Tax=Reinekea sp. G2M2-21 TaxID=2788942 RepID=UPI0018ABE33C|nr:flagellar assembly protein FliH [Reinekea sp. G2M2-21]